MKRIDDIPSPIGYHVSDDSSYPNGLVFTSATAYTAEAVEQSIDQLLQFLEDGIMPDSVDDSDEYVF